MKKIIQLFLTAILVVAVAHGAESSGKKGVPKDQLKELVGKIQAKLQDGKRNEADLAAELKAFDALLAWMKGGPKPPSGRGVTINEERPARGAPSAAGAGQ